MMALDDVVSSTTTGPRVEEAMHRTLRWIDRCIAAHKRTHEQNLFGIVQGSIFIVISCSFLFMLSINYFTILMLGVGGLDVKLRTECIKGLVARNLPGYAIGGLSGGESKDSFWRMVELSAGMIITINEIHICNLLFISCLANLPEDKPRYLMGVGYSLDIVVCSALGVDCFDCVYPSRTARYRRKENMVKGRKKIKFRNIKKHG